MLARTFCFGLGLALVGQVAAAPAPAPESVSELIRRLNGRQTGADGACNGQSCEIASLSGSSGVPYTNTTPPSGGTQSGDCCIIQYNPAVKTQLNLQEPLTTTCSPTGNSKREDEFDALVQEHIRRHELEKRACAPKSVIFAVGTFGFTVNLKQDLATVSPTTSYQEVSYDSSLDGDECLGLPGGVKAQAVLAALVASCPQTKIIMSGYSQGAMVVRNAVAYGGAPSQVAAIVTFGDPMDGAPVKGFNGPIATWCASGDGVCTGALDITFAHLSYNGSPSVQNAANFIASL